MGWSTVIGQERVKDLLKHSIVRRQLAHAYLFYGSRGVGKQAMAVEFARTLLCERAGTEACDECSSCRRLASFQHPDLGIIVPLPVGKGEKAGDDPIEALDEEQIRYVREELRIMSEDPYHQVQIPKANFIKINSVRSLKRATSLTSVEGSWKVFLILDADKMNAEASNSLLKTLEEPTDRTLLILTTSEKDRLLSTIISRCQSIQFSPLRDEELTAALQEREHISLEEAKLVSKIAQGSYSIAAELLSENLVKEREEVLSFIRVSLGWKEVALTEMVDALASSNDRTIVEHWLKVLQTWLRDAMVLREAGDQLTLVKTADKEMQSFISKFPKANLDEAMQCVESYIALVRKNVYLHLLFTALSFDLRRTLTQETL